MSRSLYRPPDEDIWIATGALCLMIAPLTVRRRFPIAVLVVSSVLFVVLSYAAPTIGYEATFQIAYFAALYAAVAWAPDRRALWVAMGCVVLAMFLWLTITYTMASSYSSLAQLEPAPDGPVSPFIASVIYSAIINIAYFGGAIITGRSSWRSALARSRLVEQTEQIRNQSDELARRAVVDERMRIARELHDVVAHHVSVIGVQAGAARTVLTRNPDAASEALRSIEGSSRQAVSDMRSLLGVLRSETDTDRPSGDHRAPEPGLADLAGLARAHRESGLAVDLSVVEDAGSLDDIPGPLALSLFRTVQESLANVARHSTASGARVAVRTGSATTVSGSLARARWVEVEVVDDGQPRAESSGSGYGLRGIQERVLLHRGEAEVGPRRTGPGWRVRVRLPVPSTDLDLDTDLERRVPSS